MSIMIHSINPDQHDNVALSGVDTDMLARVCTDPSATPTLHIMFNELIRYVLASHLSSIKRNYTVEMTRVADIVKKKLAVPRETFYGVPLYIGEQCCGEFNIEGVGSDASSGETRVDLRRAWSEIYPWKALRNIDVRVIVNSQATATPLSHVIISHLGVQRINLDPRWLLSSY